MPNQYFATNRKVGDGTTTVWEFSFAGARPDANNGTEPYLEAADVGVALVSYDAEGRETRTPVSFTLTGPSQVQVTPAIAAGQDFVIFRETEDALPVTDFTDFASISEQDLDNAIRQTLFVVQEARDDLNDGNENAAEARGIANAAAAEAASATATANAATITANTALSTANAAVLTANAADAKADTALFEANQAQEAASLIVNFQQQLDTLEATVADLTGVAPGTIALNSENLSGLTDFAIARTNLDVYSKGEVDAANTTQSNQITANTTALASKADKVTTVGSGVGLVGGGDLSENRVISLGLPSTLAGNTSNSTTGTTHSHAIDATASRTDSTPGRILLASGMNTHRTSSDHDGRYYTKTQIDDRHTLDSGWLRTDPTKILRFCVFKSSTQQVVGGDKITWSTVLYDDSASFFYTPTQYNRSLHRFTAPVSGLYEFRAQLTRNPTPSSAYADPVDGRFAVNGTILTNTGPACIAQSKVNNYSGGTLDNMQLNHIQATLWGQIILNAGDYVEVFHATGAFGSEVFGSTSGRHTWFSGRLL